uniref:Uncharacterized protein n=1 Tax=Arundo donax TaxID=35708 RepID=A0A0A9BTB2_ARUDO
MGKSSQTTVVLTLMVLWAKHHWLLFFRYFRCKLMLMS